jgi:hypothetical protein
MDIVGRLWPGANTCDWSWLRVVVVADGRMVNGRRGCDAMR